MRSIKSCVGYTFIEVCDLTHKWPKEEKYDLGSQARRSSNSAPAQLAEKNVDRHIRNKIQGVNRGIPLPDT
ncbi:MAG: four helix bundle protein [Deltaproteobacteria bacterium]|nr:four helix bundle protein [Deltaproteobacteria bacterium]